MKASSIMTIAPRTVAPVSSMLSFSLTLIVLLSGCEQAEQSGPQSETATQQQARPNYPIIGSKSQAGQSGQAAEEDLSFFGRIAAGDVIAVQEALDAGADPNAKNAQGLSALEVATLGGHSAIVEILLAKLPVLGVGETKPESAQFASLQLAATEGDIATTQALIDRGVDINVQDPHSDGTSLFLAVQQGQGGTVKMLLENGANPEIKGPRGYPPLVEAAANGKFGIAELLLQHHANPNTTEDINQWTALMMAAARADAPLVELLVNHGADVNVADKKGDTAIDIAYQSNDEDTIAAIEAEPRSPRGLAVAKKDKTGLTLIPVQSEVSEEREQPEPVTPPAAIAAAVQPLDSESLDSEPLAPVVEDSTVAAEAQTSKQVTQLLARAQKQFQQKNLTTPKGDNALDTCLEILELIPGHTDTIELVGKMEQQYRDWAASTKSAKRRKTYTQKAQELAALAQ